MVCTSIGATCSINFERRCGSQGLHIQALPELPRQDLRALSKTTSRGEHLLAQRPPRQAQQPHPQAAPTSKSVAELAQQFESEEGGEGSKPTSISEAKRSGSGGI